MSSEPNNTDEPETGNSKLARVILSLPFLAIISIGGCLLGTQHGIDKQLRDGGRQVIPAGIMIESYFPVAVYDKATDEIRIESASRAQAPALFNKVAAANNLSFLLPAKEGNYGSGEMHDVTGRYQATALDADTQRIVLHWDEMDDVSGVTTYKATDSSITQERFGLVGPGMMAAGFMLAVGLLMVFFTLGNHMNYLAQEERKDTLSHYALCALLGGIGSLMILMVWM